MDDEVYLFFYFLYDFSWVNINKVFLFSLATITKSLILTRQNAPFVIAVVAFFYLKN